jgi:hypothetical protein
MCDVRDHHFLELGSGPRFLENAEPGNVLEDVEVGLAFLLPSDFPGHDVVGTEAYRNILRYGTDRVVSFATVEVVHVLLKNLAYQKFFFFVVLGHALLKEAAAVYFPSFYLHLAFGGLGKEF